MSNLLQTEIIFYVSGTLLVILPFLLLSKAQLAWIGLQPLLSPNWISFWRLPIFYLGVLFYLVEKQFLLGYLIVVLACMMDNLDGRVARAIQSYEKYNPQYTKRDKISVWIGAWIDPLIDKITILPIILFFSSQKFIHPYIALGIIVIDILGTLIREPFIGKFKFITFQNKKLSKIQTKFHQLTDNISKKSNASIAGKIKTFSQEIGLIFCSFYYQKWLDSNLIINLIFTLSLILGISSVISRLNFSLNKTKKTTLKSIT